jgi:hypothetical protein
MKAVCIDNDSLIGDSSITKNLTIGKIYVMCSSAYPSDKYIAVIDNHGHVESYYRRRFKLLDEYRQEKLNSILE